MKKQLKWIFVLHKLWQNYFHQAQGFYFWRVVYQHESEFLIVQKINSNFIYDLLSSTDSLEVFNIDFYSKEYLFVFLINSMEFDSNCYLRIFFYFYFSYTQVQFLLYLHLRTIQNGSSGWKNNSFFIWNFKCNSRRLFC